METFIETAPGIRLFCLDSGQGQQVVLVPHASFVDDFEILARGRRLIRYDPRGRGRSCGGAMCHAAPGARRALRHHRWPPP